MPFNNGEKVFAKLRGYPPWPAKICEVKSNKEYVVSFYPKGDTATLKAQDVHPYCEYLPKMKTTKKTKSFESSLIAFFNDMSPNELNEVISIDLSKKFFNYYAHLISEKSQSERTNAVDNDCSQMTDTNTCEQEHRETHLNGNNTSNPLPSTSNNDSTASARIEECVQRLVNSDFDYFMQLFARGDQNGPLSKKCTDLFETFAVLSAVSFYLKTSLLKNQIPNVQRCLSALEILKHAKLTSSILIAFPPIVEDVVKIRQYHVNLEEYPQHMWKALKKKAKAIRNKAAEIIAHFHQIRQAGEYREDDGYASVNQL